MTIKLEQEGVGLPDLIAEIDLRAINDIKELLKLDPATFFYTHENLDLFHDFFGAVNYIQSDDFIEDLEKAGINPEAATDRLKPLIEKGRAHYEKLRKSLQEFRRNSRHRDVQ